MRKKNHPRKIVCTKKYSHVEGGKGGEALLAALTHKSGTLMIRLSRGRERNTWSKTQEEDKQGVARSDGYFGPCRGKGLKRREGVLKSEGESLTSQATTGIGGIPGDRSGRHEEGNSRGEGNTFQTSRVGVFIKGKGKKETWIRVQFSNGQGGRYSRKNYYVLKNNLRRKFRVEEERVSLP